MSALATHLSAALDPSLPPPLASTSTTSPDPSRNQDTSESNPINTDPSLPPPAEDRGPNTASTPPLSGEVPASDFNEIMSEGHSDWEQVEAPVVSPPKVRTREGGKGKEEKEGGLKGKVGEVKRVLKSGMFGSSPKAPPLKPSVPARTTARPSLAPPKKAAIGPPAKTTPQTSTTSARPSMAGSTDKPASTGNVRARISTLTKPTASSTAGASKTTMAASGTARTSSRTAVRPMATGISRSRPVSMTASTHVAPPPESVGPTASTGSNTTNTTATATATARARTSLAPARTTFAPKTGVNPRTSLAASVSKPPAARHASTGTTATVGLGKMREEKEAAEKEVGGLKVKIGELENALVEAKSALEDSVTMYGKKREEAGQRHAQALQDLAGKHEQTVDLSRQEMKTQISDLKKQHAEELQAANDQQTLEIQKSQQQIEELSATISSKSADLTETQNKLQAVLAQVETLTSQYSSAVDEASTLKQKLSEQQAHRAEYETLVSRLNTQLDEVQIEKEKLEKGLREGEEEAERSMTDLEGTRGRVEELEGEVKGLQEELDGLGIREEKRRKELEVEKDGLNVELDKLKGHISELNSELTKSEAVLQDRREETGRLLTEHHDLRSQIDSHASTIAEHETLIDRLRTELEESEAEHQKMSQTVLDHSGRVDELETDLQDVLRARQAAEDTVKSAKEEVRIVAAKVHGLEAEKVFANEEKGTLEDRVEELLQDIKTKEAEFEQKYSTVMEDATAKANAHHANELSALRTQLADTHSQLQAAHEAELESTAANHAAQLSSIAADHSTQVGELKEKLAKSEKQLKDANEKRDSRTTEVEGMENRLKQLETELKVAKEEMKDKDGEEKGRLEEVMRRLEAANDELEGTKTVLEMNKTHFQHSLEEMQAQHDAEMAEQAQNRAKEDDARHKGMEVEMEKMKEEMEALKRELQDEQVHSKTARSDAERRLSEEDVREKVEGLVKKNTEEVTSLNALIDKLQTQLSSAQSNTPSAETTIPSNHDKKVQPTSIAIPETPKKTAVVPVTARTETTPPKLTAKIHGSESGFTPSKIAIPPSPLNGEEQDEERDMDLEGVDDKEMVSKPSSRLEPDYAPL